MAIAICSGFNCRDAFRTTNGHSKWCPKCRPFYAPLAKSVSRTKWREKNPDKGQATKEARDRARANWIKRNPERDKEINRAAARRYHQAHKEQRNLKRFAAHHGLTLEVAARVREAIKAAGVRYWDGRLGLDPV